MKHKLERLLIGFAIVGLAVSIYKVYTHYSSLDKFNEQERFGLNLFSSPVYDSEQEELYKRCCG